MTDTVTLALIAAVPPSVVATCGLVVGLRNSRKSNEIHVLVNNNMSEMKKELSDARAQIATLQGLIKEFASNRGAS